MIYSQNLEKRVLSGLLQCQDKWGEVAHILNEKDFYSVDSKVHVSLFKLLVGALNNAEKIDEIILIERVKKLGVSFPDDIDIGEYIFSLVTFKIDPDTFISCVRELKKYSVRRSIYDGCEKTQTFVKKIDPSAKYPDIIEGADKIYNKAIEGFEFSDDSPIKIFEDAEDFIENMEEGEYGMMSHHPRLNECFGSLVLPGNMSFVVARSGQGKSTFLLDFTTKMSLKYDVPILHLDHGEMSPDELKIRQMSALTGFPTAMFQNKLWRRSSFGKLSPEEVVKKVRSFWPLLKKIRFYYYNTAGMDSDEVCNLIKRFYYSKVGRENELIVCYDYIKSQFKESGQDWFNVAKLVDKLKQTIQRDVCFDGKPKIALISAVQSNRLGIAGKKSRDELVEDESLVSLSDAVTQFSSHLFLLRRKVKEEILEEKGEWGNTVLKIVKPRHLGENPQRALQWVKMPDGSLLPNHINLQFENFSVREVGDLQDYVDFLNGKDIKKSAAVVSDPDLPEIFQ